ncbi:MAG: hypothetical protein LUD29_05825 [Clostridia bacterium]|nr:hypothetical protein [Clostridia bacterium]
MPKKRRGVGAFEITLSAMSCALGVIFLYVGTLTSYVLFICYIAAEISLMLPLTKQFYTGEALAYLACCIITILMGAIGKFWDLVPFIMFFGLHPLANALQLRFNINRWLAMVIKIVWFDATCYVSYLLTFKVMLGGSDSAFFQWVNRYMWLVIIVGGSLIAVAYDYLMFRVQMMVNNLIFRVRKNK